MFRKYLVWLNSRRYEAMGFLSRFWVSIIFIVMPRSHIGEKGVVISLTSYPKRIDSVHYVVKSLLIGKMLPEKIVLWLGHDEMKGVSLPKSLLELENAISIFEIRYVNRGLKSYDKLVHSIEEFPHYVIVTVDDDALYPRFFLKELIVKHREDAFPIVCYRGIKLEKNGDLCFKSYDQMLKSSRSFKSGEMSYNLMPTGCAGILYPPGSLSALANSSRLIKQYAPHADDIWFKACALSVGTPTILARSKSIRFSTIGNKEEALYFENVVNGGNDKTLKIVFDYFNVWDRLS